MSFISDKASLVPYDQNGNKLQGFAPNRIHIVTILPNDTYVLDTTSVLALDFVATATISLSFDEVSFIELTGYFMNIQNAINVIYFKNTSQFNITVKMLVM